MPLNYRQLSERSRHLGGAYIWSSPRWRRQGGMRARNDKFFAAMQQRMIRLATILKAQQRRQYLKQTARARKVRKEKLWLKRHGHMMFDQPYRRTYLGKRKR